MQLLRSTYVRTYYVVLHTYESSYVRTYVRTYVRPFRQSSALPRPHNQWGAASRASPAPSSKARICTCVPSRTTAQLPITRAADRLPRLRAPKQPPQRPFAAGRRQRRRTAAPRGRESDGRNKASGAPTPREGARIPLRRTAALAPRVSGRRAPSLQPKKERLGTTHFFSDIIARNTS